LLFWQSGVYLPDTTLDAVDTVDTLDTKLALPQFRPEPAITWLVQHLTRRQDMLFDDRHDAGERLALELLALEAQGRLDARHAVIVALPRGGVAVGFEIARQLGVPLDVCVVRKVGVPAQPEVAVAAVAEGGELVVNKEIQTVSRITDAQLAELARAKQDEVTERVSAFRGGAAAMELSAKTVVLVDDGLATGATAMAAIKVLRKRGVGKLVLAIPVCPIDLADRFAREVDELVVLQTPEFFQAVGQWYQDFDQVTDQEVTTYLQRAKDFLPAGQAGQNLPVARNSGRSQTD
jgi:putative phosphoribosyl transferase